MTALIAAVTDSFVAAFPCVGDVADATVALAGWVTVVGVAAGAAVACGAVVGAAAVVGVGAVVATGVGDAAAGAGSVGVVAADVDGVVGGCDVAIGETAAEDRPLTSDWLPFPKAEEQPTITSAMTTRKMVKENLVRMGTSLI